jgi:hypothetical protein
MMDHPRDIVTKIIQESLPARLRVAPLERRELIDDAIMWVKYGIAGPNLHQYATCDAGARFILGESPASIARGLTAREAHYWIHSNYADPLDWIVKTRLDHPGNSQPKSISVARWTIGVMADPPRRDAALRNRQGWGGAAIEGRVVDRLDEILPCDLHRSPWRTIEAAVERQVREEWDEDNELSPEKPWHKRLPTGVVVLRHYDKLRAEGVKMRHCVSSYAKDIASEALTIVSIRVGDKRSTAEIGKDGRIGQHVGYANTAPPLECVSVANEIVRCWSN